MPKKIFNFTFSPVESAAQDEAEIMVYSEIVSCKWDEHDDAITAKEFDGLLKKAKESGATKLRLRVNSPGGSVWQAVAMKSMLETSAFEQITVDIEGICASAATFLACVGGAHVRIAEGSEFMIHNPACVTIGGALECEKTAARLRKMEAEQHTMYAARTGMTEEKAKELMDAETWMTAEEAVAMGFADEVISTRDAAASISTDDVELMRQLYSHVPEIKNVSTAEPPVASGGAAENRTKTKPIKEENMNISELTEDQLRSENPALYESIMQRGAMAERARVQEIDALTDAGFEELAQQAKSNGTSASDFLRSVVAERKKHRATYLQQRVQETAPSAQVVGGAPHDNDHPQEDKELAELAKESAALAATIRSETNGGMF